jgi:hypothetical protein
LNRDHFNEVIKAFRILMIDPKDRTVEEKAFVAVNQVEVDKIDTLLHVAAAPP